MTEPERRPAAAPPDVAKVEPVGPVEEKSIDWLQPVVDAAATGGATLAANIASEWINSKLHPPPADPPLQPPQIVLPPNVDPDS